MTKIIDLGEADKKQLDKKPIKFLKFIDFGLKKVNCTDEDPSDYDVIELVCQDYDSGVDIMFAYNDGSRNDGVLYFGHLNDGVV